MDENTWAVVKCSVTVALTRRRVGRRVAGSAAYKDIVRVTNVLVDAAKPRYTLDSQYGPGPHATSASGKKKVAPAIVDGDTVTIPGAKLFLVRSVLSIMGVRGNPDAVADGVGACEADTDDD